MSDLNDIILLTLIGDFSVEKYIQSQTRNLTHLRQTLMLSRISMRISFSLLFGYHIDYTAFFNNSTSITARIIVIFP